MPDVIMPALEVFEKFISIAETLAKLPALALPQYQASARDLYEICKKLLTANENLFRWIYRLLYFDFRKPTATTDFVTLVGEYKAMKIGPEFQQLKFSCGDIGQIYRRDIESKLGKWFARRSKLEEAQGVFTALSNADNDLVAFIYDQTVPKLDDFVNRAQTHVDVGALADAEAVRLEVRTQLRDITEHMEKFSGDLSDLVLRFARIAQVPLTL